MEFYLFDFLKKIFKVHNWLTLIYVVLNVTIITFFIRLFYTENIYLAVLIGCLLYFISLVVALSSIGEWLLRKECKCIPLENKKKRKPTRYLKETTMYQRLEPLFNEVVDKARGKKKYLPEKITLFYQESSTINAFALGRKTICVTEGIMTLSDEEIKGVLGHELGHISNHDTDFVLFVIVGNIIISTIIYVIKICAYLFMKLFQLMSYTITFASQKMGVIINNIGVGIYNLAVRIFNFFIWLFTKLGMLLISKIKRNQEFKADNFSKEIGYRDGLLSFFNKLLIIEKSTKRETNIFAILNSSHPKTKKRIENLLKA